MFRHWFAHRSSQQRSPLQVQLIRRQRRRHLCRPAWQRQHAMESLEDRRLLAADAFVNGEAGGIAGESEGEFTFTNPANPFDVNGDGYVTPADVRLLFTTLQLHGAQSLRLEDISAGAILPPGVQFLDVTADGWLTTNDLRTLFVHLISRSGNTEPEAERHLLPPQQLVRDHDSTDVGPSQIGTNERRLILQHNERSESLLFPAKATLRGLGWKDNGRTEAVDRVFQELGEWLESRIGENLAKSICLTSPMMLAPTRPALAATLIDF